VQAAWSMWEIVLPALGFEIVDILDLQDLDSLKSTQSVQVCFMHGNWEFVKSAWVKAQVLGAVVASLAMRSSPILSELPATFWLLLRHAQCDGVTSGSWWCGTSFPHSPQSYPLDTGRRLKHILSPMHSGRQVVRDVDLKINVAQPLCTPQGFDANGLLPVDKCSSLFVCPSVYKKLVLQRLSDAELRNAWDIGSDQAVDISTAELLASVPAKVLLIFGQGLFEYFSKQLVPPSHNSASVLLLPGPVSPTTASVELRDQDELNLFPPLDARQRAAKNDNLDIQTKNWDGPFWSAFVKLGRAPDFLEQARVKTLGRKKQPILDVFRAWLLRVWRVTIWRSLFRYLKSTEVLNLELDRAAARDCLRRVGEATFWDWSGGSRLLFWRWPAPLRIWARDGLPVFHSYDLPNYRSRQPPAVDARTKSDVAAKLRKFVDQGYISPGPVNSLISYFWGAQRGFRHLISV
jgi:hypothetical protein